MFLCPGMCTDAMCPMRGGLGPEGLAILKPEEGLLRGRCFLNMAGSRWLWIRHHHPPLPQTYTNSGHGPLCVSVSCLHASILRGAQSGGGEPDVVWRWQQGLVALGRHSSLGMAHGQAAPRRQLPSMRLLPSCLSSASWGCWASWCVTCSSGRATTARPTRKSGLVLEVEAAVRPSLGTLWGGQRAQAISAQLSLRVIRGDLLGLEG